MSAKATAIIPARLGSTRFPRKALADETGKALVVHVCEQTARASSIGRVVVACDSDEIGSVVEAAGFESVLTRPDHTNGTSRLEEAASKLGLAEDQVVVNVQGDEPEIEPAVIDGAMLAVTTPAGDHTPWAGTVASPFADGEDPTNPNIVKAVTGLLDPETGVGRALYFSRALVPFDREGEGRTRPLKHVGIYAYTVAALRHYVGLAPTPLEDAERLEQLRWLEHGHAMNIAVREASHHGIDTPEQYAAFVSRWQSANA